MNKRILLIITGSIAAVKAIDVIRQLRDKNCEVTCIITEGGKQFVTPMSLSALTGNPVYHDLFSLKDEVEMGHIRLSRENDIIAVVPASADIVAKMSHGMADDLASTVLLASDKPILIVPAMNVKMWENKAVQRNITQLKEDGVQVLDPDKGSLACGEVGAGRMAEPDSIVNAIING